MDIGLHQFAERRVHGTMARQRQHPLEPVGGDPHPEVTAAVCGADMADVAVRVVDHLHCSVRKAGLKAGADGVDAVHGSTFRNGMTSTEA